MLGMRGCLGAAGLALAAAAGGGAVGAGAAKLGAAGAVDVLPATLQMGGLLGGSAW